MSIKTTHTSPLTISPKGKVTWNSKKPLYCKIGASSKVFISDGTIAFTPDMLDAKHLPQGEASIGHVPSLIDLDEHEAQAQATPVKRLPELDKVNLYKSGFQVLVGLEICGHTVKVDLEIFQHFARFTNLLYYTEGSQDPIVIFDKGQMIAVVMPVQM